MEVLYGVRWRGGLGLRVLLVDIGKVVGVMAAMVRIVILTLIRLGCRVVVRDLDSIETRGMKTEGQWVV
jgi:hypothetical protein